MATNNHFSLKLCCMSSSFFFVGLRISIIILIAPKIFREFIEGLDLFVGRYLVLIASGYIIVKVIHFKVFPDFP